MQGFNEIWVSTAPRPRPALGARLPQFITGPSDAVERLRGLRVALIGVGSVGRNIAMHLARLQVAVLWLVDSGRLKAESLLTHAIAPRDVPQAKATNLGRACKRLSPQTRVFAFVGPAQSLPLPAFADADLVVLATDNLLAEVEVGQRCLHLGLPLVHASVHGDTLVCQCRFFANHRGEGPCPACGFTEVEWGHLHEQTTFSCEGAVVGRRQAHVAKVPTMSVSFLCSAAGDLAMVQILRYVLDLGAPVGDTLAESCGFTHKSVVSPLTRDPACVCDHVAFERASGRRALPEWSLRQLAASAGLARGADLAGVSFTVDELSFAEEGVCGCGRRQQVRRFVGAAGQVRGRCRSCGARLVASPFHSHRPVPAGVLGDLVDRPLRLLGAGSAGWVVARRDGRGVLFLGGGQGQESRP